MRDRMLDNGYFERAYSKRLKFIESFESKVLSNTDYDNNHNATRYSYLRIWYFEKFMLEYCMGRTSYTFVWSKYFNAFSQMNDELIDYKDVLQGVSMGILFDAPDEDMIYLKNFAISRREYDDLLRLLTAGEGSDDSSQMRAIIPENNDLIQGMETKNPQFVMNYLNSWYKSNEGEYWHGEHTDPEGLAYIGYWCIETAAAVKKFNIPYDSIRNHKYFPVDLVEMDV